MSPLEKMARAIGDEAATMDDDVRHVLSAGAIDRICRAALLAIREPDARFSQTGRDAFFKSTFNDLDRPYGIYIGNGAFSETFTAMIDAILNQEPRP